MKEPLTPEKIQKDYSNGDLGKENAAELLISLIEGSDNTEIRVKSITALEKINFHTEKIFKTLENYMLSDENAIIRASVVNYILHNFLEDGIPALGWVIHHERSPLVFKLIFDFIKKFDSYQLKSIKKELINWNEEFSSKIGVVSQESIFFLDLEALFARGKRNYEINPLSYKLFEKLSDRKNGEPWLVIKNRHTEVLNFNYFKWNFIKDNIDLVASLSKLQDLDFYLCSLRKYCHGNVMISTIPESIGSLTNLKKLTLQRNNLKNLPFSTNKLTKLKELDISYNKFVDIPQVISTLSILETLNIKHNMIQNIPESLLPNIKVIS